MNKIEFFEKLKAGLKNLPESERQEIFSEYEEHFRNAALKGKSEDQICRDLGSVEQIVNGYKIDHIMQTSQASKVKSIARAALILLAMAPLNFLIFMGPFFVTIVMLITFWCLTLGMFGGGLAGVAVAVVFFSGLYSPVMLLLAVGIVSLSIFLALVLTPLTHLTGTMVLKYLKWNLEFARGK